LQVGLHLSLNFRLA